MPARQVDRSVRETAGDILAYTADILRHNTMKQAIVFLCRSFYRFSLTRRWIAFIEAFSVQASLGKPPLELVRKAFSAYFTLGRSLEQREALLENHYRIAQQCLHPEAFRRLCGALWAGHQVELGVVSGKKDQYRVWLRRADQCGTRHEGEWTAGFESTGTNLLLCRITFILARAGDGSPTVAIGGLQGPFRDIPKGALVTATRDLGGLRPKDAMLLVTAGMAQALGATTMLAIDNDNHPINCRARRRRSRMLTDYDTYWRERGGEPDAQFGFVLPVKDPALGEPGNRRRDDAKKAFFACGQRLLGHAFREAPATGADALDATNA